MINKTDIQKLAQLACLSLNKEEEETAIASLNAVLDLLDALKEADVNDIDEMTHVQTGGASLRLRNETVAMGYLPETLLSNALEHDDHYFLVPKIIE